MIHEAVKETTDSKVTESHLINTFLNGLTSANDGLVFMNNTAIYNYKQTNKASTFFEKEQLTCIFPMILQRVIDGFG